MMQLTYQFPFLKDPIKIFFKDLRYIKEVLLEQEYSLLYRYNTVIDIGANIGTFSIYVYDKANKIYAVEPISECLDCFKETIVANNLTKINIYKEAIAGKTELRKIIIKRFPTDGACTIRGKPRKDEECRMVKAISLVDFMDRENIPYADLVKLDVEGAEEEILTAPDFPKERIGTIVGEFHHTFTNWRKEGKAKGLLEQLGYAFYHDGDKFIARRK